jgi:hypothetical protein
MSDELYFGHQRNDQPRHHTGPFSFPPYDEYDEHGPLEGESLNEHPQRRPLNVENLRRMMKERNPHGE